MKCDISDDHEWKTNIAVRTNQNTKCPYCSGQKVSKTNNLKTLYPAIAAQWHPSKNGDLKPENFKPNSGKIIWWICDKNNDHELNMSISYRTKGIKCKYCKKKMIKIEQGERLF